MSFKEFFCEVTGENCSSADCLMCAREGALPGCDMTPAIISGIIRHQRPVNFSLVQAQANWTGKQGIDLAMSVTELLSCPRKKRLETSTDWAEKPSKLYYAYRGTLFHGEAEAYAATDPWVISENRLFWFFKYSGRVVALSGQPDLLVYRQNAGGWFIVDYKTIKEVPGKTYRHTCLATGKVIYEALFKVRGQAVNCPHCQGKHSLSEISIDELPPQPRGTHSAQVQLYALLIEQNLKIITEKANRQLADAGISVSIPANAPILGAELAYMDMSRGKRITVPILEHQERVGMLKSRLFLHLQDQPAALTDPAEVWQCDYCPVHKVCSSNDPTPVAISEPELVTASV